MKKIIIVTALLISNFCFSQLTVTDPGLTALVIQTNTSISTQNATQSQNLAKTVKILANGKKLYDSSKKTVKYLKDAKDLYDKVNSALNSLQEIDDILELHNKILKSTKANIQKIRKARVLKNGELNIVLNSFNSILNSSMKSIDMMNKLLSSDMFKMNDADRLDFLQKIKIKMQEDLSDTRIITSRFQQIINKRIVKKMALKAKELNKYN